MSKKNFKDLRREYHSQPLSLQSVDADPIRQFEQWFEYLLAAGEDDPTAMTLSTVDEQGCPDSRIVLLKDIADGAFVFFTNYESQKAKQLNAQPKAALNFYWPSLCRQIRIRGTVSKVSAEVSNAYFASRPRESQVSAIVSPQSQEISRDELEQNFQKLLQSVLGEPIVRPKNWGGYALTPFEFEFWHGRKNRLHDRIHYVFRNNTWHISRIAP